MTKYIGTHISSRIDYLIQSTQYIMDNGGNLIQIMVDPLKGQEKKYRKMYTEFRDFAKKNEIQIVVHASYIINLARKWDSYSPSIRQFIDEIKLANFIGANLIVVHMGKFIELTKEEALNNMYTALLYVHQQTKKFSSTKILLETPSGQGSEIGYKIEDFSYFYKKISKINQIGKRFGICVDTCHVFAAGYDLTSKSTIYMYLESFEELIGLRHIKLIHLNDSKKELGSKTDRHDNIGIGKIGVEGLVFFANYFKNINIPIVLETPFDKIINDLSLIKV